MGQSVSIKQSKFSNGEIAPENWGDVKQPKWDASLRTCKNWLPIPAGASTRRPGFKYIALTRNNAAGKSRLIPFVFSDGQTWVLEFSNLIVRFYQNGVYLGVGGLGSGAYRELPTVFTEAMLPYIKFSQIGNTITLTYGGQVGGALVPPQDLVHTSGALWPWTISATPLTLPFGAVLFGGAPRDAIAAYSPTATYSKGDRAYYVNADNTHTEWVSIQDVNKGNQPPSPPVLNASNTGIQGSLFWMPAVDDTANPAQVYNWACTAVVQDPNGITFESGLSLSLQKSTALSSERRQPLDLSALSLVLWAGYTLLYFKIYRSTGGTWGLVSNATTAQLVVYPTYAGLIYFDDGRAPDLTMQPPAGTDPFLVNGVDSYPSVVGYLDQRRVFAASLMVPHMLHFSRVGDLYNWDTKFLPGADTDAFDVLLSSEVMEQVRSIAAMKRGIILTGQGEWTIAGLTGGPVARNSVDPKRQSKWGSNWLNPIIIGTGLLFSTAKSNQVRDFYPLYGLYADIWDGQDLTVLARHLFDNYLLSAWAFQSAPYPVTWAVRNDGALLSLTYQHAPPSFGQQLAEGICAWAPHTTGLGSDIIEDVCVVPEPPEDAVYVIVKRLVNGVYQRSIERMSSPVCPASPYLTGVKDVRYGLYLDCASLYDGHNDKIHFAGISAGMDSVAHPGSTNVADFAIGSQITISVGGAGPFVAADADPVYGSVFVFDPENTLGLGAFKATITGYTSATVVTAQLLTACTVAQLYAWAAGHGAQQSVWGLAKSTIQVAQLAGSPMDSLDANGARGVLALVDGDVAVPVQWGGAGAATLDLPVAGLVIAAGLSYNADMEQLDAFHPSAEIRNRFKNVMRLGFECAFTRDLWAGPDFTRLTQWDQRQVADAYGVIQPQSGYFEINITGDENKQGLVAIRHFQPLPATITALLREMDLGGT